MAFQVEFAKLELIFERLISNIQVIFSELIFLGLPGLKGDSGGAGPPGWDGQPGAAGDVGFPGSPGLKGLNGEFLTSFL